jgi:uncharacterized protein
MKISKEIIRQIEFEARTFFSGASGCHDWTHIERVRSLALVIGKKEGADLGILEIATLLHDIGRKDELKSKGNFCHAEYGAKVATELLKKYDLSQGDKDNITHCIISHRFRNDHKPETIEAKCLFDADKLDSIGAIGIARAFLFAGGHGSNCLYTGNEKKLAKDGDKKDYSFSQEDSAILEYEIKLKYIKKKILTKTGKKIAQARDVFMQAYFKQFWLEVAGKK